MVQSVNPPDVPRHQNPIPAAAIHRGVLVSSAIGGVDPATGEPATDKPTQIALAFANLRRLLGSAGAALDDVVKIDLYFQDKADRPLANTHWLEMYPDEHSRPARHAHLEELPAGYCLQIVVMAIIGDGINK